MADYVEKYADKASDKLEKQIKRVYKQAAEEVQKKLDDFIRAHKARDAEMSQKVANGELSEQNYKKWMQGQVFQGKQWRQKLKDVTDVYVHADEKAREIVGKSLKNVFMESANYTAYDIEKGMRGAVAFNVYDAKTVERLLKDNPKMLPEWKIDQPKDYTWNEKRVRNAVTQGIIQGESIEKVGSRLTEELATSNAKKMDMFARTAVNGAQNAGRMDRLHEAEDMGIEVKKKWLATLDNRTRDTHQALDGQEQPVDEPFVVDGMEIDYPGDPFAPPELVYNCFVGETSAYTNCEIERSYSHEYKGELIEIETSCGVKFTCTPNHPILTLDGWVSAASLHNGDDLLVTKVGNRLGFGRNCNVKHVLPCMKTFHDSFKGSGLVSRNSSLSVNFHGDIPTSEVEIITKERFLPDNRNPGISERIKKFLFELPYKAFACKCSFMKHLWRIGFSTFGFICGNGKSFPLFWGRFGHSQKHGLRPIALFNPSGVQPLNDNVAGNIQFISNCLDGFTGIVLADNIISVNKRSGCTHVYNLQTENGYYFVNTIITKNVGKRNGFAAISHNCRCTLTYVYPKYQHLQHNHERRDQLNDKNIENMTYYEWAGLASENKQEEEIEEEEPSIGHKTVQGKDISKTWTRRPDQFKFEIEDVINAQGFDSVPRVVSEEEFRKAVERSNFIAQRTYSAPNQETLDAYRQQLYSGKWYVDCSVGGSSLGQGMYGASTYGTEPTKDMAYEMKTYQNTADVKLKRAYTAEEKFDYMSEKIRNLGYDEQTTQDLIAVIGNQTLGSVDFSEAMKSFKRLGSDMDFVDEVKSKIDILDIYEKRLEPVHTVETFTLTEDAKTIKYSDLMEEYNNYVKNTGKEIGSSTYAAAKGYDAIVAPAEFSGADYVIVLNRTACIFLDTKIKK